MIVLIFTEERMRPRSRNEQTCFYVLVLSTVVSLVFLIPTGLRGRTTGRIEGYIRDAQTGEPLYGVEVSIEGAGLSNRTGEDGFYFIPGIPAGPQDIMVRLLGYKPVTVEGQLVLTAGINTLNIELTAVIVEVGDEASEYIEGENEPLVLADHNQSTYWEPSETIQDLPIDNYRDIVTLEAGTVKLDDVSNALYPVSVRGGRPSENAVFVDGVNTRLHMTDQNIFDIPEMGTEEIDVITGAAGYEYGEAQSGVINVVSRQGGNNYAGRLRFETDELAPSGSNYGYNRLQFSVGGPVPRLEDVITFFFSGELTGHGDMHPRADGFKGRHTDIEWLAELYSNDPLALEYLGQDLDIREMLNEAKVGNPEMPVLNIDDYRTDGGKHAGRLVGNEGDETRLQAKLTLRPAKGAKLTGTFMTNRDQGMLFDRSRLFWEEYGNGMFRNESSLGIIDYTHTLTKSEERWTNVQFRAAFQKNSQVTGSRFNLDDEDPLYMQDLGFRDLTNVLNYRTGDIPIFLEHLDGGDVQSLDDVYRNYQYDFELPTARNGQNPFGIGNTGFLDADVGSYDFIGTMHENRVDLRLDVESQLNRVIGIKAGLNLTYWDVDWYSNRLTSSTFLDFYTAEPRMLSFYVEDRLRCLDFLIDLGLRVDSFDAGIDYPSILGRPASDTLTTERKTEVAPRISVSHPLSDNFLVRASYGVSYQVPQFTHLFQHINVDLAEQQNTNQFFGNPDLGMRKTTSFEFGLTALFLDDWAVDFVGYNKDFDNNVVSRYIQQDDNVPYLRIFTNDSFGFARGLDTTLRKRLSNYFSTEFTYSLCYLRAVDSDPADYVINEGFFLGGPFPPTPPEGERPTDFDQRHSLSGRFNVRLPSDFREGSLTGRILKNTDLFFTALLNSGRPFTEQNSNFDFTEERNTSRTEWEAVANLRAVKSFDWGGLRYGVFVDVRNLFNTTNQSSYRVNSFTSAGVTNGIYQTSGSPYSDGGTVRRAIYDIGVDDPSLYTGPRRTDINGDGVFNELDDQEIARRLDFNGDGQVGVEEELAMRILGYGAYDANPLHFDIPRLIRFGVEVSF